MKWLVILPVVFLTLLLGFPASGTDFQKGLEAYNRGDNATALREWKPLAMQGNADAQANVGVLYGNGNGVPLDRKVAVGYLWLAAMQGHTGALFNLGVLYEKGGGYLPQDYIKAHMWFNIAASRKIPSAMKNRDRIAKKMTPEQIAEAQRMALEWIAKHQK